MKKMSETQRLEKIENWIHDCDIGLAESFKAIMEEIEQIVKMLGEQDKRITALEK